ncbi:protein-glutamate O-methyltransferase CheR [Agrobacterium vitis]|uniref:Protein-glutamate O-methyltransferase CheR n=1 Tax=Agrobacterium vitis TaxID=373 RepID=A0A120DCT4_AGRVI|nr:CheR family methyltransferase [Agrobacterium vitis]MCF1501842.1 protein-glutamate O-methyltransferase CheR [Allorhizobium sp. Av2]KAA3506412.1 protein-glutamate O-methyltransferase CheR [Agrobacterium vitis]KAA3520783.1 protein-glutamate O-methyltransferase CheR [Agrobacterium vitis]MCM2443487.1 protein-glutamate O-methyltransferase CheR [Agrobacterium vitis]MUO82400.1 protein-glutamate O-methyltransferase CheR [Agrobacterium vitis]
MSETPAPEKIEDIEIRLLLEALFLKYHYDFRNYAMASIKRRLKQARQQLGFETFSAMQESLLHDPGMLPKLLRYLTVQVSEMFRDPSYFKAIREKVVPHLRTYPSLKVWVAGCSEGEELYSLVILFREEGLEDRTLFYATDINQEALQSAEAGIYALERVQLFTENHRKSGGKSSLSDYYQAAYGSVVFDSTLRRNVLFSDHSLVTDAVFAEMQLISCRNVMIYFDRPLQDRALGLFKDSLARKGFLGLGSKESLRFSNQGGSFSDFVREEKIYQRRGE